MVTVLEVSPDFTVPLPEFHKLKRHCKDVSHNDIPFPLNSPHQSLYVYFHCYAYFARFPTPGCQLVTETSPDKLGEYTLPFTETSYSFHFHSPHGGIFCILFTFCPLALACSYDRLCPLHFRKTSIFLSLGEIIFPENATKCSSSPLLFPNGQGHFSPETTI